MASTCNPMNIHYLGSGQLQNVPDYVSFISEARCNHVTLVRRHFVLTSVNGAFLNLELNPHWGVLSSVAKHNLKKKAREFTFNFHLNITPPISRGNEISWFLDWFLERSQLFKQELSFPWWATIIITASRKRHMTLDLFRVYFVWVFLFFVFICFLDWYLIKNERWIK